MRLEHWREIARSGGYLAISDLGRVRREKPGQGTWVGRIIKTNSHHRYPIVFIRGDSQAFIYKVAYLVLGAFVGSRPGGMECCHRNDIKKDSRLSNLHWGTSRQNRADRKKNSILGSAAMPLWKRIESARKGARTKILEGIPFGSAGLSPRKARETAQKAIATRRKRGDLLGYAALSKAERRRRSREAWATMRKKRILCGMLALSRRERLKAAKKAQATIKREGILTGAAAMSKEVQREVARKAWITKRRNSK